MNISYYAYTYIFIFDFFFFHDTATTEIYTLSLHDALPIFAPDGDVIMWKQEPKSIFIFGESGDVKLEINIHQKYDILSVLYKARDRLLDRKSTRLNSSH